MKLCLKCKRVFNENGWSCSSCGWSPVEVSGFTAFAPEVAEKIDPYETAAYAELYELESDSFWFRNRNKLILQALAKNFPDASSLFEIGCGNGFVLAGIAAANPMLRLVGSDLNHKILDYARTRLPVTTLQQMDAKNIPYVEEFDVICAFDVLEHIPDDEVLNQIHQALKRGGGLIITVPQHPWLWSRTDDHAGHIRRYTRRNLCRKLIENGFQIVMTSSFISFLLPLLIFSRLSARIKSRKRQVSPRQGELYLPLLIDGLFEKTCLLETFLISRGLNLPIGGSLLCVATKR